MPDAFAGLCFHADQTLTEEVVAGPLTAVEIVAGRADRQVDIAQFLVRAHRRPDVGRPRGLPGVTFPGLVAVVAFLRDRAKLPDLSASARVKALHITRRRIFGGLSEAPIDDRRTDDHHPAADDRRRGDPVVVPVDRPTQRARHIHITARAKCRIGHTGRCVDCIEAVGSRAKKNAPVFAVAPIGDATQVADKSAARPPGLGIKSPQLLTRHSIHRAENRQRRSIIEHSIDD